MPLRRLVATTVVAVATATTFAACGSDEEPTHAATEGIYVNTGDLKYQVQISRQLNPTDPEDRDYLVALPPGTTLGPRDAWFGVFLRVFNMSDAPHESASRFRITDTTGKAFEPIPLNPATNVTAFKSQVVGAGDQNPVPGSLARENLTQGGLILFKVPVASFANRPLELHITPPEGGAEATVDLDV
jgi:hypothetical protein